MVVKRSEVFGVVVGFLVFLGIVWVLVDAEQGNSNPCTGFSGRNDVRCMGYYTMPSPNRRQ